MKTQDDHLYAFTLPSIITGVVIFIAAVVLTASLCSKAFTGSNTGIAAFGAILFTAYGWSSFFIPFHLIAAAVIAVFPGWKIKNGLLVLFSVFPFFSAVAAERILTIQNNYSFTKILGTPGICFLAVIIIAIEYTAAWFASSAVASKLSFSTAPLPQKHFATGKKAVTESETEAELAHIFTQPRIIPSTSVPVQEDVTTDTADTTSADENASQPQSETSTASSHTATFPDAPILKSRAVFNRIFEEHTAMETRFGDYIQNEIQNAEAPEEEYTETKNYTDVEDFDSQQNVVETIDDDELENCVEQADADEMTELNASSDAGNLSCNIEQASEPASETEIAENTAVLHIGVNERRPLAEYEAILEGRPFQGGEDDVTGNDIFDEPFSAGSDDEDTVENDSANDSIAPEDIDIDDFGLDTDSTEENDDDQFFADSSPDADEEDAILDIIQDDDSDEDDPIEQQKTTTLAASSEKKNPPADIPVRKLSKKYEMPTPELLTAYPDGQYWVIDEDTREAAAILKETLNEFKIDAEVTGIRKGPVITMFEILPAPGVKLQKIVALQDNIALRLAASSIRIIAPIPGKHAVGIEVPNKERAIVSFREMIESEPEASLKMAVPVVLGKDITGGTQYLDLATTPHLLIAGSTGAGKSVCVNSMILSILYKRSPQDVKMILIDPKIVELKLYNDIPHLLTPVITEPKRAYQALQYCLCEMERRYAMLDGMGVRDIKSYNRRIKERNIAAEKLPYIIVIIDEFADLMATTGKELESTIARLAAMSRAVGIHLVLATQRPSIDVITGLIKANIPSRIAFMVASKMDSRIIIDQVGAEKLLGKGDMLYSSATSPFPSRIQGAFVTDNEVEKVAEYVRQYGEPDYIDDEIFYDDDEDDNAISLFGDDGEDPLYEKALEIVMQAGKASASYIQRRLKIGYNRAARLVEEMELRGIVGPANGSKPRDVIHQI